MLNSIWLKRVTKNIIGEMNTNILDLMSKECTSFTNRLSTMYGKHERMSLTRNKARNLAQVTLKLLLQRPCLLLLLLLRQQMHPSYLLQSLFRKLSRLPLDSVKINSKRFGNLEKLLRCFGKLNGPNCRTETIMDVFLLPFIFSFQATISFLLLLQALIQVISSRQNIIWFTQHLLKIFNQGILQTLQWIGFLFWLFMSSYSGRFWLQVL